MVLDGRAYRIFKEAAVFNKPSSSAVWFHRQTQMIEKTDTPAVNSVKLFKALPAGG